MKTNQPIKLLVDAHTFDGEYQGSRTFIKEIYLQLANRTDIILYLAACNTDNLEKVFPAADNIVFVKFRSASSVVRLLYDIPSIIRKYKIDYAHFQYIVPPIKNCKFIVTIHDVIFIDYPGEFSFVYRTSKKFLFRIAALQSEIVTTVSNYSKTAIQRHLGIKKEITVVENGVHEKFYQPYDKAASKKYIANKYGPTNYLLYVSRFEPRKNHDLLLKAWLELALYAKGYYLVLLGERKLAVAQFDDMLNSLPENIRSFIFISNTVDDADLLEFYRGASVFVYPSKAEGFGIPPLEAAALKIPVICSNSSAMSDFTFFGNNHIDPLDYELFKSRLTGLLQSPPPDKELAAIADAVKARYSWAKSADKLYGRIING